MSELTRFGVSIEKSLVDRFDNYVKDHNYNNRSSALAHLIRDTLVQEDWTRREKEVAGTITMVYDHHKREMSNDLIHIQHDYHHLIISTQHIHLDHDNCLEVIIVKGMPEETEKLFKELKSRKGIKHVSLSITTTGEEL